MRGQRADARRNYELLVLAAREIFSEQGPDAPLEAVARRAGVGNATMYRHFASRHDLVLAAHADGLATLCAGAATADPFDWLRDVVRYLAGTRDLATALIGGDHGGPLLASTALVLARLGADLDAADVLVLAAAISLAGPERHDRLLNVLRHGMS